MSVASRTLARSDQLDLHIVAGLDVHPAVAIAHAHSTGRARVSDVVRRDRVTADSWRIFQRLGNACPLALGLEGRDGFPPWSDTTARLYLRAVNAVVQRNTIS